VSKQPQPLSSFFNFNGLEPAAKFASNKKGREAIGSIRDAALSGINLRDGRIYVLDCRPGQRAFGENPERAARLITDIGEQADKIRKQLIATEILYDESAVTAVSG
jgi:hypothetical protein